jgi:serine/threonine-protein kinase
MSNVDDETQLNPLQGAPVDRWIAKPDDRTRSSAVFGEAETSAPSLVLALPEGRGPLVRADRYRPGRLLGRGGMGEVRLTRDERIGREVAIKTLLSPAGEGSAQWRRFVREARVQGQLEHPAIVPVHDLDISPEQGLYFSMRRVQGQSLKDVLQQLERAEPDAVARWSRRKLLTAFVQICLAIHYAHSRGVVHRDLKPGNIMLGEFGEVQVIDWGLARVLGEADVDSERAAGPPGSTDALTMVGDVMGTPAYMPPEQFDGDLPGIGPHSDIYALGMILYEIFALSRFHLGKSNDEIRAEVRAGIDLRAALGALGAPPEIQDACARATARRPHDRLRLARELADAVEGYLDRESDRARRQQLADEHTSRALAAVDAIVRGGVLAAAPRRAAIREALQALALDPSQREARQAFVRLLTEVPAALPAETERELDAQMHHARRWMIQVSRYVWALWIISGFGVIALGIRSWPVVTAGFLICIAGLLQSIWLARRPTFGGWPAHLYGLTFAAEVAIFSCWLGPFVLVPTAAVTLLMFRLAHSRAGEHWPIVLLAMAVVIVPHALEFAGLLPPSFEYVDGGLLLLPRALDLHPTTTTSALLWSNLTFIVTPAIVLARLRDALSLAERRLALHALQLRQLLEDQD